MIKILKDPEPVTVTCNRCGCKFQYDWTDVRYLIGSVGHVYCPVCDLQIQHIIPKSYEQPLELHGQLGQVVLDSIPTTVSDIRTTSL